MVSTTDTQGSADLFKQAMRKLEIEILAGDAKEKEILAIFHAAFSVTMQGLIPALKLVDRPLPEELTIYGKRGVLIKGTGNHALYLLRDGRVIFDQWDVNPWHVRFYPDDCVDILSDIHRVILDSMRDLEGMEIKTSMAFITELLTILQSIEAIISEAKKANEKRHAELEQLLYGLNNLGKPKESKA